MDYAQVVQLLKQSERVVETPDHPQDLEITWIDSNGKRVGTGYDYRSNRQPKCSDVQLVNDDTRFTEDETAYLVTLGKR